MTNFTSLALKNVSYRIPDICNRWGWSMDFGKMWLLPLVFPPCADIYLTNDSWETFSQKQYTPQSEAMNVTAIAKIRDGKIVMIGCGLIPIHELKEDPHL